MGDFSVLDKECIKGVIYTIRDQRVILDRDLAKLYQVETKALKRAVKRNIKRFPDDFMFQLSDIEWETLKSQNESSSWGGRRKLPNVFTEHGVLMLSSALNSKKAIAVNIQIMRIFTKLRTMLTDNLSLKLDVEEIKKKVSNQSKNIELVFQYLDELVEKKDNEKPRTKVGYKKD